MEGKISYIVTVRYRGKTTIAIREPGELRSLYLTLRNLKRIYPDLAVLDTQRSVVSPDGKVVYAKHLLKFDEHGLEIHDMYWNLIDSYYLPDDTGEIYEVERRETWVNRMKIKAHSEEEAVQLADAEVENGGFDVLEGWQDSCETFVVRKVNRNELLSDTE